MLLKVDYSANIPAILVNSCISMGLVLIVVRFHMLRKLTLKDFSFVIIPVKAQNIYIGTDHALELAILL